MAKTCKGKSTAPKAAKEKPAAPAKVTKPVAAKPPVKAAPQPAVAAKAPAAPKPKANGPELHNAIAQRAFELSRARAFEPGHEVEDWLMAEKEVLANLERQ